MCYTNVKIFSRDNYINADSVSAFLKGDPVAEEDFKAICNVLDFDWEAIQNDPFPDQMDSAQA
jgi:hypothetical protein